MPSTGEPVYKCRHCGDLVGGNEVSFPFEDEDGSEGQVKVITEFPPFTTHVCPQVNERLPEMVGICDLVGIQRSKE